MKFANTSIFAFFVLVFSPVFATDTIETTNFGKAEVSSYYQLTDKGVAILTLVARVPEINNALRGLKNSDQRRLSKIGQLTYQCKLLLYKSEKNKQTFDQNNLNLTSRNYSLFTGVNLPLAPDERLGIQIEALQTIADNSLFGANLGNQNSLRKESETVSDSSNINLQQFDVNVLNDSNLIETSESIEIVARFPVYQLEKPVSQWRYNFNLKDFKQAIQYIDENCTPINLIARLNQ